MNAPSQATLAYQFAQALPREDWGLFGPKSPTWRVWSAPTALMAFQRSIVVESFDPFLAAAVEHQNGVRYRPASRFDRTIQYFLTVACGDSRAAIEASEMLMKIHARATGIEPISGQKYSANDPASQLWIHVTGWHSNLLCYERFAGGPLSVAEEKQYWADCVTAAELQTCSPADVPRSRDEVRDYFAKMRPRLCLSEHARTLIHYFLHTPRNIGGAGLWAGSHLMSAAVISTIPRWMRELGSFDQSKATDAMIQPLTKAAVQAMQQPMLARLAIQTMAPSALPVFDDVINMKRPLRDEVLTPTEARRRYGKRTRQGEGEVVKLA